VAVVRGPGARLAGALAHFILEAVTAARDADDALLRDLEAVVPSGDGVLQVTLGGQRLEVQVRPAQAGFYLVGEPERCPRAYAQFRCRLSPGHDGHCDPVRAKRAALS
jgi:hypothetical protein